MVEFSVYSSVNENVFHEIASGENVGAPLQHFIKYCQEWLGCFAKIHIVERMAMIEIEKRLLRRRK